MSGNEERVETNATPEALVCPYCGSRKFAYVYYAFNIDYYNDERKTSYERGWETTDSEGWQCDVCERYIEDAELREAINWAHMRAAI